MSFVEYRNVSQYIVSQPLYRDTPDSCQYTALIYIYTVGTESIQTPLNFSLFVILQPFAKII